MNAAEAGPAVTKSGKVNRTVFVGPQEYVIKHEWRPDEARGVLLKTSLMDTMNPNRVSNKQQAWVDNTEETICSRALMMVYSILKNKRERWQRVTAV